LNDVQLAMDSCDLSKCFQYKDYQNTKLLDEYQNFLKTKTGKEIVEWSISLLCVAGSVPNGTNRSVFGKDHKLFQCITPLSFNFEGELQTLLINVCKLNDKNLEMEVKDMIRIKDYAGILKADGLECLDRYDLCEVARKWKVETNNISMDKIIESIKKRKRSE